MSRQLIPYAFARNHGILITQSDGTHAQVLLRQGASITALGEIHRALGLVLSIEEADADSFDRKLAATYSDGNQAASDLADGMEQDLDLARLLQDTPQTLDLLDSQDGAPIIRMINALLTQALREGASDIHIEPYVEISVVRFRIDGVMRDIVSPPRSVHAALVSRIKVMANLDIAEKRLPQDGRISLRLAGRTVDVRVSTLPAAQGERAVLRLLDKDNTRLDLPQLGMSEPMLKQLDNLIKQPHGIFLVTGPTGSGKTTTLYAALSRLDATQLNIMTVEDPIEYELTGIGQTQVNARIDLTFARALRSILRQDPDVIMIGEIRDLETAQIAVQASLTGHLVLATLHTNDAASAVTRLADMGIEPFLLASSLLGVMAQRLVRRLCPVCRKEDMIGNAELKRSQLPTVVSFEAPGCAACGQTGYRGRTGIYELLLVDEPLRALIHERAGESAYRLHAHKQGMVTLREDGVRWLKDGTTSVAELLRVTRD
ncbi:MAG: type II secretion system ATPase GspE [Sulfuritalea sp.]|jgi:general secretion pathway protein E|nr:type II secretion system ATPase GspE [Sulfuritalea sp.]